MAEPVVAAGGDRVVETGRKFDAQLEVAELDERGRPSAPWSARGKTLSRSNIVFFSRRMCYLDKSIVILIHLIDDTPVAIFGSVVSCEYLGDGRYQVDLGLRPLPSSPELRMWIEARGAGKQRA